MRRVLVSLVLAVGLAGVPAGAAFAQDPEPTGQAAAPATPGKEVCTISDDRLAELSGMVTTATGYIVVNDSSDRESRERVFLLSKKCNVKEAVAYGGNGPRDTEDLALSPDKKNLWIADIGDNEANRETIGLWKMPVDGSDNPELYRLSYPDGAKDAEALLMGADGLPIVITKGAKAGLYKTAAAPKKGSTTPLQKVGEITLPRTTTGNPLGPAGRVTVTGAAAAPDGSRVVLRTYADAFEWDVQGGDIVASLTSGKPRITPLPDEPWGESISYSADGGQLLTVSETAQQDDLEPVILRYSPAKDAPAPVAAAAGSTGAEDTRSFFDKLDLGDITALIGAVGFIGVLLVVAGIVGIVQARRRSAAAGDAADDDAPVRGAAQVGGPATEILARQRPQYGDGAALDPDGGAVYGAPPGGGVYGAAPVDPDGGYGAARPGGAVYGAAKAGGGVYGGAPGGGAVYGAAPAGGYDGGGPGYERGGGAGYGGERDGGPVYGGRGYASADQRYAEPGYGDGGDAYGGGYAGDGYRGGYPDNGQAYPGGYRGDGYADDGYADAGRPAGGRGAPDPGYGYDDPGYGYSEGGPRRN